MNHINVACNCFKCACGNCSVCIKSVCDENDIALNNSSLQWPNPICTATAILITKYNEFQTTSVVPCLSSFVLLHCNLCNMDVCYYVPMKYNLNETYAVINPSLRNIEELRKNMIFSETYGLWLENVDIIDDFNSLSFNDPIEKMLFQKKQDIIDALFEEKERRVREFVMLQEDLFEEKRREVKKEYLMVKQQCSQHRIKVNPVTCDSKCAQGHTDIENENPIRSDASDKRRSDNIFLFEEEDDDGFNNCTVMKKQRSKMDNKVFSLNSTTPKKTSNFPATFKDLALEKSQQLSDESISSFSSKKQSLL